MITSEYSAQTIYICRSVFRPKAVCYGKVCRPAETRVKNTLTTDTVSLYINGVPFSTAGTKRVNVDVFITKSSEPQNITVYILPEKSDPSCLTLFPPCSTAETLSDVAPWKREGDYIAAELPLVEHCGVESFRTDYTKEAFRLETPARKGHADGRKVTLTFDAGGYIKHRTRLDRQYLVPGYDIYVSFKMNGLGTYSTFAFFSFQTNIFTSAVVKGCGLAEKKKFYTDPHKPELGYYYQYVPAEGGEGALPKPEWIYDIRFRYMVSFKGADYWIKPAAFAVFSPGDRAAIIKGGVFPMEPDPEADSSCVKDTLSEQSDRIVSEYFYRRV